MEVANAKEFVYFKYNLYDKNVVYVSKDLYELVDLNEGHLTSIYAVLETEDGETMCTMDFSYSGEPLIMRRHMHKDSWMKFHNDCKFIYL